MNVTDYTQPDSTLKGPILPARFSSYMLDLVKIWLSDPRNITEDALKGLRYVDGDSEAAINGADVFVDIAWPDDQRVSGKTPAIIVMYGNVSSESNTMAIPITNPHFPGNQQLLRSYFDIHVLIKTSTYAGTQVLTEMLFTYLRTFSEAIKKDSGVSMFYVSGMTAPELSQSPGDVKDVFKSSIVCKVASVYVSTIDTVGPVFRGIKPDINYN